MAQAEPTGLADRLEAEARRRYVRWDAALWRHIVQGPAQRLLDHHVPHALVDSYLQMAATGIGLGYLFPAAAGQNCFTLAWTRLVPERLPDLPSARQPAVLAALWNLAENLEHAPVWLRHACIEKLTHWPALDDLDGMLAQLNAEVLEPPVQALQGGKLVWVYLAAARARFLPGQVHFVAPTVVCVHERGAEAVPHPAIGVWLRTEGPVLLGSMACDASDFGDPDARVEWATSGDARVTALFDAAANLWRCAATLRTSQYLVARVP